MRAMAPPARTAARATALWARAYDALGHVGGLILAVMAAAVFLQVVLRFLGRPASTGSRKCRAICSSGWS